VVKERVVEEELEKLSPDTGICRASKRARMQGAVQYTRAAAWELFHQLLADRIVVLSAPVGVDRSAVISGALMPMLAEDGFQVLHVRRMLPEAGSPTAACSQVANPYLLAALRSLEEAVPASQRLPPDVLAQQTFSAYLDYRARSEGNRDGQALVLERLDQILNADKAGTMPIDECFAQIGIALRTRNRWALFSVSEEAVGKLERYAPLIPLGLQSRFHLGQSRHPGALSSSAPPSSLARQDAGRW
jgi:hypothetical protein